MSDLPIGTTITAAQDMRTKLWQRANDSPASNVVVRATGPKGSSVMTKISVGKTKAKAEARGTIGLPSSGAAEEKVTIAVESGVFVWGARTRDDQVPQLRIYEAD
jgi:hypothetical protein